MKVLYVVTAYPRWQGDIITPWLVETLKHLRNEGIQVTVFAPSYKGLKDQVDDETRVKRFRYFFKFKEDLSHDQTVPDRIGKSFWYKLIAFLYMFMGSLAILRFCRREKFDVIHVHWPFPHFWFGYVGSRANGAKIVSSFHGAELRWVTKKMPIFVPFLRWAIKNSDVVTCNSSHTQRELQGLLEREVEVVPFGSSISSINSKELTEKGSRPYLLFVGRLVERKGVPYLLEAFRILAENWSGELLIIGEGPAKNDLINQAQVLGVASRVRFPGFVTSKQLQMLYQNCSVFVLPAITDSKGDTEGLGVVLVEALSYKKPVVASAVGGIPDVIIDGQTGLLVPEKDPLKLAEALRKVLQDQNLADRLGENGYEHCLRNFSWESIIQKLNRIYTRLLKRMV
ncbi:MAG: hypothetical protein A2142_07180 [candidate division Zixibacteria bacterium RBG_16_48_11]|nr:MAG: hypothetical protein A2142_07180 [candidate division Zixibacteria bacterium RBG_16_48_11]